MSKQKTENSNDQKTPLTSNATTTTEIRTESNTEFPAEFLQLYGVEKSKDGVSYKKMAEKKLVKVAEIYRDYFNYYINEKSKNKELSEREIINLNTANAIKSELELERQLDFKQEDDRKRFFQAILEKEANTPIFLENHDKLEVIICSLGNNNNDFVRKKMESSWSAPRTELPKIIKEELKGNADYTYQLYGVPFTGNTLTTLEQNINNSIVNPSKEKNMEIYARIIDEVIIGLNEFGEVFEKIEKCSKLNSRTAIKTIIVELDSYVKLMTDLYNPVEHDNPNDNLLVEGLGKIQSIISELQQSKQNNPISSDEKNKKLDQVKGHMTWIKARLEGLRTVISKDGKIDGEIDPEKVYDKMENDGWFEERTDISFKKQKSCPLPYRLAKNLGNKTKSIKRQFEVHFKDVLKQLEHDLRQFHEEKSKAVAAENPRTQQEINKLNLKKAETLYNEEQLQRLVIDVQQSHEYFEKGFIFSREEINLLKQELSSARNKYETAMAEIQKNVQKTEQEKEKEIATLQLEYAENHQKLLGDLETAQAKIAEQETLLSKKTAEVAQLEDQVHKLSARAIEQTKKIDGYTQELELSRNELQKSRILLAASEQEINELKEKQGKLEFRAANYDTLSQDLEAAAAKRDEYKTIVEKQKERVELADDNLRVYKETVGLLQNQIISLQENLKSLSKTGQENKELQNQLRNLKSDLVGVSDNLKIKIQENNELLQERGLLVRQVEQLSNMVNTAKQHTSESQRKNENLSRELIELNGKLLDQEKRSDVLRGTIDTQADEISRLKEQYETSLKHIRETRGLLEQAQIQVGELDQTNKELQDQGAITKQEMQQLKERYAQEQQAVRLIFLSLKSAKEAHMVTLEEQNQLAQELNTTKEEATQLKKELEQNKNELAKEKNTVQNLKKEIQTLTTTIEERDKTARGKIQALNEAVRKIETAITGTQGLNFDVVDAAEELSDRVRDLVDQNARLAAENGELNQQVARLKEELRNAQTDLREYVSTLSIANAQVTLLGERLDTATEESTHLRQAIEETVANHAKELQTLQQTYKDKLSHVKDQSEEANLEREALKLELRQAEERLEIEYEAIRGQLELKLQGSQATIQNLNKTIQDLTADLTRKSDEIKSLRVELSSLRDQNVIILKRAETSEQKVDTQVKELNQQAKAIAATKMQTRDLSEELEKTAEANLGLQTQVNNLNRENLELVDQVSTLTKRVDTLTVALGRSEEALERQKIQVNNLVGRLELTGVELERSRREQEQLTSEVEALTKKHAAAITDARSKGQKIDVLVKAHEAEKKELLQQIQKAGELANQLQNQLEHQGQKLEQTQTEVKRLTSELESAKRRADTLTDAAQELGLEDNASGEAVIQKVHKLQAEAKKFTDLAGVLSGKLTASINENKNLQSQIFDLSNQNKELLDKVSRLEKRLYSLTQDLDMANEALGQKNTQVNSLTQDLNSTKSDLTKALAEQQKLTTQVNDLTGKHNAAIADAKGKGEEIAHLVKAHEAKKKELLQQIQKAGELANQLQNQLEHQGQKLEQTQTEVKRLTSELKSVKNKAATLAKDMKDKLELGTDAQESDIIVKIQKLQTDARKSAAEANQLYNTLEKFKGDNEGLFKLSIQQWEQELGLINADLDKRLSKLQGLRDKLTKESDPHKFRERKEKHYNEARLIYSRYGELLSMADKLNINSQKKNELAKVKSKLEKWAQQWKIVSITPPSTPLSSQTRPPQPPPPPASHLQGPPSQNRAPATSATTAVEGTPNPRLGDPTKDFYIHGQVKTGDGAATENKYSRRAIKLGDEQKTRLFKQGLDIQAPGGKPYKFSCASSKPTATLPKSSHNTATQEDKIALAFTIISMINNVIKNSGEVHVHTHDPFVAQVAHEYYQYLQNNDNNNKIGAQIFNIVLDNKPYALQPDETGTFEKKIKPIIEKAKGEQKQSQERDWDEEIIGKKPEERNAFFTQFTDEFKERVNSMRSEETGNEQRNIGPSNRS